MDVGRKIYISSLLTGFKEDNIEPSTYSLEILKKLEVLKEWLVWITLQCQSYIYSVKQVIPEELAELEEVIGEKLAPIAH